MKKPATLAAVPKLDLSQVDLRLLVEDFKTLDPRDPGAWPLGPRIIILLAMFLALLFVAGWFGWQVQYEELGVKQQEELKLKDDWLNKKKQAVNLDEYRNHLPKLSAHLVRYLSSYRMLRKWNHCWWILTRQVWGVACNLISSNLAWKFQRISMLSCQSQ